MSEVNFVIDDCKCFWGVSIDFPPMAIDSFGLFDSYDEAEKFAEEQFPGNEASVFVFYIPPNNKYFSSIDKQTGEKYLWT